MKALRLMLLALPVMYLSMFSCKDNDPDVQPENNTKEKFVKTVDTIHFQLDTLTLTAHADEDFALAMVIHHKGIINLANLEVKNGRDESMKAIAQKIINRKTAEKTALEAWLVGRKPTRNPEGEQFDAEMMAIFEATKDKEKSKVKGDPDYDFAQIMLIHNQAVVEISQAIIRLGHHDDMKEWARQMITDQNESSAELNAWLSSNSQ